MNYSKEFSDYFYSMCGVVFNENSFSINNRKKVNCLKCGNKFVSLGAFNHVCANHDQGRYQGPIDEEAKIERREASSVRINGIRTATRRKERHFA